MQSPAHVARVLGTAVRDQLGQLVEQGREAVQRRRRPGVQLGFVDGELVVLGHNGLDPGVCAVVAHYPAAAATIVVLCNHDRGAWPVYEHLAAELGLADPRD